ncbi:MAG: type IV pilin N-terminal domain-containing protein [Candidatus Pacearchaeota archaeon]
MIKKINKKAVSPVIATILLIAMVIIIALIIFLWFRSLTKDAVTKFGGTNIELVCQDVQFSGSYSGGILIIENNGNVPIYGIKLKILKNRAYKTEDLKTLSSNWPTTGLKQGGIFTSLDISSSLSNPEKIVAIPVLIGSSKKGNKIHVCEERYGHEITIR